MNLSKKKLLAVKTLRVGKERITFSPSRLDEIKEAITKQDIKDLVIEKAITIKEIKGRAKVKKKRSRSVGNIRKKPNKRKKEYVILIRKLRKYVTELKKQGKLNTSEVKDIRKRMRNKEFRSKAHLKERLEGFKK